MFKCICIYCGYEFESRYKDAQYCCDQCANDDYEEYEEYIEDED